MESFDPFLKILTNPSRKTPINSTNWLCLITADRDSPILLQSRPLPPSNPSRTPPLPDPTDSPVAGPLRMKAIVAVEIDLNGPDIGDGFLKQLDLVENPLDRPVVNDRGIAEATRTMESGSRVVRVLCRRNIAVFCRQPGIYWFIGSPLFLPPLTVVSVFKCAHSTPGDPYSPDYVKETDSLKSTLLRGFNVVGGLYVCDSMFEENAIKAVDASQKMKQLLGYDDEVDHHIIGASVAPETAADVRFFASQPGKNSCVELITAVHFEDDPEEFVWENGCLLRCQMEFKMPVYMPISGKKDAEMLASATDAAISKLRDPKVVYLVEGTDMAQQSIVLRGAEISYISDHRPEEDTSQEPGKINLPCSYFSKSKFSPLFAANKSADAISVRVFFSQLGNATSAFAPTAEYTPAPVPVKLKVFDFKVDVLCYASKDFPVSSAVSRLVIPGISDQLAVLSNAISLNISSQQSRHCPFHFCPLGILHPITVIYDLRYGESKKAQVDIRKSLHLRLGLPLDRPLLLIANSVAFRHGNIDVSRPQRSGIIKDVHHDIPRSGVSGGLASLVDGSYEYYHYLQDGFDDSGWGCAYRSLQTIISWFIIQHYTSIEVPSHREIQQALVEIGDKEPYFVGSREWIGAIELSFVLDKLLGVSCKIINVRTGAELPEKCRELSMHFETQGTPIMIGGGVLAYTLLGVDYNEVNGDCAFLILDPHYTSSDDHKKIANGGWCGWKKPVDNKGKNFFLHDKFYNLLLPQRPNMV